VRQVATCNASYCEENEPAAAGDFEFAKNRVKVLFHHRQTQPGVIGDLLVAPALANKLRNFLLAPCQPDKSRQIRIRRHRPGGVRTKILAPDKEMWPCHAGPT
jgi:hypothetical protein